MGKQVLASTIFWTLLTLSLAARGKQLDDRPPYHDYDEHPTYNYKYEVKDDFGNHHGHEQTRDGLETRGSYHVLLPDGRTQTVTYYVSADSGFVAEVTYDGQPVPPREDHARRDPNRPGHRPNHIPGPYSARPRQRTNPSGPKRERIPPRRDPIPLGARAPPRDTIDPQPPFGARQRPGPGAFQDRGPPRHPRPRGSGEFEPSAYNGVRRPLPIGEPLGNRPRGGEPPPPGFLGPGGPRGAPRGPRIGPLFGEPLEGDESESDFEEDFDSRFQRGENDAQIESFRPSEAVFG